MDEKLLKSMKAGDMLLLNLKNIISIEPIFYIKEEKGYIERLKHIYNSEFKSIIFKNYYIDVLLVMVRFNKNDRLIYGQWFNRCNKRDKRNIKNILLNDEIKFNVINEENQVIVQHTFENCIKDRLSEYIMSGSNKKWNQEMFDNAVSVANSNFNSKSAFFNAEEYIIY